MKIHVVVGIIRNKSNQVLIAERPAHTYKGGLWEFPGGKIEIDESALTALERELHEELGIHIEAAHNWFSFEYDYVDRLVLLDIWEVTHFSGVPHGAEGQKVKWVEIKDLNQFEFPAGNKIILEKLQLSTTRE